MNTSTMQLKFDPTLPYQRAAIDAAVGLFAGQPLEDSAFSVSLNTRGMLLSEQGLGNNLLLDQDAIFANLQRVQEANGVPKASNLLGRDYAVEMETGTGKTYVYLRTAFELNATYGFKKFVIVVPSVPIREGVLHSISIMRDHFRTLYGAPFDHFVYDSKQVGKLRAFATANTLQLMVINIQAFQRDIGEGEAAGASNVIYRELDRLSGQRPIDFLRATRPIVIIDEPQKMSGAASAAAIARLEPLCTLQYSATHTGSAPRIYKLDPIEALDQKLVKKIEVASIREEESFNDAFVRLLKVEAARSRAQIEINVQKDGTVKQQKKFVKARDHLHHLSGERQEYANGFIVSEIRFEPGNEYVAFSNGRKVGLGETAGGFTDDVMRVQIRETIKEHLEKEKRLRPHGVKVLSLFFIDRVANYRVYNDDGSWSLGKIGQWFEEEFRSLTAQPTYLGLIADPVEQVHNGYFSQDRRGGYRDTSGTTKDDDATYALIMRDKEKLLSFDEPLRFIFSHSALREGWDNPNVFQICTLRESGSETERRQMIGRGLRLPVNQSGERIHEEQINRLTVVANESFKTFASGLQSDYERDGITFGKVAREAFANVAIQRDGQSVPLGQDDSRRLWTHLHAKGYFDAQGVIQPAFDPTNHLFKLDVPPEFDAVAPQIVDTINRFVFSNRIVDARKRQPIRFRKEVILDPEFKALWDKVSQKTRFRVAFDTEALIADAAKCIHAAKPILPPAIAIERADLTPTLAGISVQETRETYSDISRQFPIPDVLAYLQNATELTRHTLAQILIQSGRAEEIRTNPQAFITMALTEIQAALNEVMLAGIQYELLAGQTWEMRTLEKEAERSLERYLTNLYHVQHPEKTIYDYVEYQSKVEEQFARDCDNNDRVRFFVKLPSWFTVDTPLGPYNPDWAVSITDDPEKLYLVSETKGSLDPDALRGREQKKIDCARKHFQTLHVGYQAATSLSDTIRGLRPSPA
ncbi:MAG: DEAD/DEAH box helicase family protein [Chloroflexota bacterium]|nr:DEAD/DEAH box helicase family protein [Chloroflexota bacterium]